MYAVFELGGEDTVVSKHNEELIPIYHGGLAIGGLLPSLWNKDTTYLTELAGRYKEIISDQALEELLRRSICKVQCGHSIFKNRQFVPGGM